MTGETIKVVKVVDDFRVVINRGRQDGIIGGERFMIYELGEELFDPDTEESLGRVEIVKGRGKATHVQERITTVESYRVQSSSVYTTLLQREKVDRQVPYEYPTVGDLARKIE